MFFQKSIIGNSRTGMAQWEEVRFHRDMANNKELTLYNNAGFIPRDLYQDFDNTTIEVMHFDDGDTFLNDLFAHTKAVSIGIQTHNFRMVSESGNVQTSMGGQVGVLMDQVEYSYDGFIVPIQDGGYKRNFREKAAFDTAAGFDALVDDDREHKRTHRKRLVQEWLTGHRDKQGVIIDIDGRKWEGMKNDSHVAAINIGASLINFDFTDKGLSGQLNRDAFQDVIEIMTITNNCGKELTVYISREIGSNWDRTFSTQYRGPKIFQEMADIMGVKEIKVSSALSGNEFMGYPLDRQVLKLPMGMGMNTVVMPRPDYNSDHRFVIWGAQGFGIANDFNGQKCAFFAQDLG